MDRDGMIRACFGKKGLKACIRNTHALTQMSKKSTRTQGKCHWEPGTTWSTREGLEVTLHPPVFWLSHCLKALMRSDLWANICSRRTLRAERSVLPMLSVTEQRKGEEVTGNITGQQQRWKLTGKMYVSKAVLRLVAKDSTNWNILHMDTCLRLVLSLSPPLSKCKQKLMRSD